MDKFKQEIRQKLIANIIIDKCKQSEHLIFRDAWCTQERVIRFTTPFFREFMSVEESQKGKWKTGDCVMYEVENGLDSFVVNCVLSIASVNYSTIGKKDDLLLATGNLKDRLYSDVVLKSWDLTREDNDVNKIFDAFDELIEKAIPRFEQEIIEKLNKYKHNAAEFKEGNAEYVTHNIYERNAKARAACIAFYGTTCAVCGIDFGKEYGPEFSGRIEVHHIVPISEIGKEYVVDPIKDLVPVCPNCHTALHSKKDGVYTVQELRNLRSKNKGE